MTAPAPVVSVVVPAKNDSRFIETNIASILSQDYPHIECIVVDGGSTDATIDLLERYGSQIRWISEADRGAFDAINKGWKLATGDILTWLNADDFWEPGAVRAAVEFLQAHPDVDVVYGTAGVVDEIGRRTGDMVPRRWDLADALLHCDHIIFQPASFIRRPILERVGWLYPAWCHDHDLWLRIAVAGGTFGVIPQRLAIDRLRFGNLGSVGDLVIPNKIALTRRFFDQPGLPPELRRLRRRSMSNAYLRGFDYLQPERLRHWGWSLQLAARALAADPTNLRSITERASRPLRGRIGGGMRALRRWSEVAAHGGALLRTHGVGAFQRRFSSPDGAEQSWLRRTVMWPIAALGMPRQLALAQRRLAAIEQLLREERDVRRNQEQGAREAPSGLDTLTVPRGEAGEVVAGLDTAVTRTANVGAAAARLEGRIEDLQRILIEMKDSMAVQPLAGRIDELAASVAQLADRAEHGSRRFTTDQMPPDAPRAGSLVVGSPPTLRPIGGWHTYWGIDASDRLQHRRFEQWSTLEAPLLMQWLADLLVVIYPGNELSRVLYLTGNFEPNEMTWLTQSLHEGMTMVDVGAHMGMYTIVGSRLVGPTGTVVAIEPSSREFQRLAGHVAINGLDNVRCLNEAASDDAGDGLLTVAWEWNSGHNTLGSFTNTDVQTLKTERVRMRSVDAIVAAEGLERVDVLKIDAEGHETRVLAGARTTLERFRPQVLLEVFGEALIRQGSSVASLLCEFERYNYDLLEFGETGELIPLVRTFDNASCNLVARPR